MSTIVYVLTNPAMSNLVKIGKTSRDDPRIRMKELYSTGVPLPFECAIAIEIDDDEKASSLEKALHIAFEPQRVNPSREFFEIETYQAEAILEQLDGKNVTPEVQKEVAEENKKLDPGADAATKAYKSRRPNFNFTEMGIPIGATLVSINTEEEVTVADERKVICRGKEEFLTRAVEIVLGLTSPPSLGVTSYWKYEGRRLNEIYRETYGPRA